MAVHKCCTFRLKRKNLLSPTPDACCALLALRSIQLESRDLRYSALQLLGESGACGVRHVYMYIYIYIWRWHHAITWTNMTDVEFSFFFFFRPYIDVSGNIFSTTTKKRHNAKFNVCCNSSNLIYCLTCGTCEKQYVGMTKRKLKQRLYEHLRNIRQGNLNDPIGRHFSKVPHNSDPSKVKVHVLSFITHPPDSRTALNMRLRFELDWIHRLRTTLPRGLNAMD